MGAIAGNSATTWQHLLQQAGVDAQAARFDDCLATCQRIVDLHGKSPEPLLGVGAFLLSFGFLAAARQCFLHARSLVPNDVRPLVNLANLAQQAGEHGESRRLYTALLEHMPDQPVIRRNALVSLEYDPEVSDAERVAQAKS